MAPKSSVPLSISGYSVLPIELPPVPSFPNPATHYLYIHPHEPRVPEPDSSRSLFIVNVPITTTETHLRHLFSAQLSSGRVERVDFHESTSKNPTTTTTPAHIQQNDPANSNSTSTSKKRKRVTAEDLQHELDTTNLPQTWDRPLHASGSHAIVVFVDRPSMEASLKAIKKAAKSKTKLIWGQGVEDEGRVPALGIQRYKTHNKLQYPSRAELLRTVSDYMTLFGQFEEARMREAARGGGGGEEVDEDGFVTVTRGTKINSVAREEELRELLERQRERNKGLGDFYRFQMREKRKERQGELVRRFEEDKRKVEEMRRRRGKVRPE